MRKTNKLSVIAIFSAVIIVLQLLSTYIKFGSFNINLTLIPIIVAGCVYGEAIGALMGLVSGAMVVFMVVTGLDPSGTTMLAYNAVATVAACLTKGVLSGYVSALLYKVLSKKNQKVATIISAISCPIVNTFTFTIFLMLFFGSNVQAMIGLFLTTNFVIELLINALIAPRLTGLIKHSIERYN